MESQYKKESQSTQEFEYFIYIPSSGIQVYFLTDRDQCKLFNSEKAQKIECLSLFEQRQSVRPEIRCCVFETITLQEKKPYINSNMKFV